MKKRIETKLDTSKERQFLEDNFLMPGRFSYSEIDFSQTTIPVYLIENFHKNCIKVVEQNTRLLEEIERLKKEKQD